MKKGFLLFMICLPGTLVFAQEEPLEKIETDRPDQTESPSIVPKRWFQLEAGLVREEYTTNALYVLPTLLSKYGVSKKLELRLITEYTSLYQQHFTDTFGLLPVRVGFKYNLLQEKGVIPQTSFIAHVGFNRLASKYFKGHSFLGSEFRFTMRHTLTDRLGLGYNVGAEWEQTIGRPVWIYTFSPGYEIGKKWYAYIELFGGFLKYQKPAHNLDGGVAYYLSDNMLLDLSGGIGLSNNSFDHYIAVGFSFRVPASKSLVH